MSEGVHESPPIEAERAKRLSETEPVVQVDDLGAAGRLPQAVRGDLHRSRAHRRSRPRRADRARREARRGPAQVWSRWQPDGSETARVRQIADHVSTRYRFADGDQLVVALGGPPTVTAGGGEQSTSPIPVRAIAVRPDASTGKAEEDDISIVDASKSMQFVLCGLGQNCSISQGEASAARHSLLRRQALELSLYTFKYVDDIDSVTVFLPPPPGGESPGSAVFLRRGDVKQELSQPLSRTMAPGAPSIGSIPARELQTLNRITSAAPLPVRVHAGPGSLGRARARSDQCSSSFASGIWQPNPRLIPRLRLGQIPEGARCRGRN